MDIIGCNWLKLALDSVYILYLYLNILNRVFLCFLFLVFPSIIIPLEFRSKAHLILNPALYFIYCIPLSLCFICPFFFRRFLSRPFLSFFLYAFSCPLKVFKFSDNLSDNLAITFRCKRNPGEVLDSVDPSKKNSMKKRNRLSTLGHHVVLRLG